MKVTSTEILAKAMKLIIKDQQFSQEATADRLGIKQATVSAFGNQPDGSRLDSLFTLLAALEIELHDPLGKTQWKQEG
tara:strand:+ start:386 stop:619 length:234 start_codon:yes stop_codon:yes gene_type:complete